MACMQADGLSFPLEIPGDIRRKRYFRVLASRIRFETGFDRSSRSRYRGNHIPEPSRMRLDDDAGEPRFLWSNSDDNREKVKIRMSAPGVRIRTRGLWLFCPSGAS